MGNCESTEGAVAPGPATYEVKIQLDITTGAGNMVADKFAREFPQALASSLGATNITPNQYWGQTGVTSSYWHYDVRFTSSSTTCAVAATSVGNWAFVDQIIRQVTTTGVVTVCSATLKRIS